jgi:molybdopterin-guanine dinucleotide biosynthesis protein A
MTDDSIKRASVGVILAGGRSRRLGGGDKCLLSLGGRPILEHVIVRARPQVGRLILSANGPAERFAPFGLPVVPDGVPNAPGPLAGVLAAMDWAAGNPAGGDYVASFTADCPFIPNDIVARLIRAALAAGADVASATSAGRRHPATAVWRVGLRENLRAAITVEGFHRVGDWAARHRRVDVEFAAVPVDPFFNINTAADLMAAEKLIQEGNVT